jgi:lipoprotein NlpD
MRLAACLLMALLAGGCASKPPAPVIDRSAHPSTGAVDAQGNYRVRRGDTLHAIAFRFGLDHRDIAAWNGIRSPYVIYPDQSLRLIPPPRPVSTRKSPAKPGTEKPVAQNKPAPGATRAAKTPDSSTKTGRPQVSSGSGAAKTKTPAGEPRDWLWPVKGRLLRSFAPGDPARNGLDIAGSEGSDVQATAGGTVVYSGNGLIGYGELIIIKHSDRMLSAYAHNRLRLVAEGDSVKAGQRIAEMGRNDRNEQLLHFEIRENGRPVNPLNYLPRQ